MASSGSQLVYNYLGSSGLKISNICLGTMTFSTEPLAGQTSSVEEAFTILDEFVKRGGNFIDTADIYSHGKSEEVVGKWLQGKKRENIVLATKVFHGWNRENVNRSGLTRAHIMQAVDDSLQRLKTSYIDLYQIHCWDEATPVEETFGALNDLVRMGKVHYLGVSNVTGWQLQKIVDVCKQNRWAPIVSLQQQWSLLSRETELELIDVCQNEGIGFLPWSPLKGGWLSGKYKRDMTEVPADTRLGLVRADPSRHSQDFPSYDQFAREEKVWQILDAQDRIAKNHGRSVAQVALRWLLQKPVVPSVVIGVRTEAQFQDNVAAGEDNWSLSDEEMSELDAVSAIDIPYPYQMIQLVNKRRAREHRCK